MVRILIYILALSLLALPAQAANRALVIGNGAYSVGGLRNPVNDARGIAADLRDLGFDQVILETDIDRRKMIAAIQDFGRSLQSGDVAVFYYSGHGVQSNGRNYLIPLRANIQGEADLEFEAVDVYRLLGYMSQGGARLNVVILDACRDNPFKSLFRSSNKGLVRLAEPRGTLLAYATRPGDVARDVGGGNHSPYTAALRKYLKQPGLTISEMFNEVGRAVLRATSNQQEPWISSSVLPRYCFAGCEAVRPQPVVTPQPVPTAPDPSAQMARLLQACTAHLAANRLTTGAGGTAFDCYQDVLKQDPTNAEALKGLNTIAERYVGWAEGALGRGDRARAQRYLERLAQVSPEHPKLASLTSSPVAPTQPTVPISGSREFRDRLRDGTPGPVMIRLPGGTFQMGSPARPAADWALAAGPGRSGRTRNSPPAPSSPRGSAYYSFPPAPAAGLP